MKIGQQTKVKEDFEIGTLISGNVITVKEGDKGFIDSKGFLHLTTGSGRSKIVKLDGITVDGYDHEGIATLVFSRLSNYFNLDEMLENEDIDKDRFIEEIEDVLTDIL